MYSVVGAGTGTGTGTGEVVDFIVISGREAGHYHLDEINKRISIFFGGKNHMEYQFFRL